MILIKILLILLAFVCVLGIGACIGIFLCLLAIDDILPPFPNYFERQKNKRGKD